MTRNQGVFMISECFLLTIFDKISTDEVNLLLVIFLYTVTFCSTTTATYMPTLLMIMYIRKVLLSIDGDLTQSCLTFFNLFASFLMICQHSIFSIQPTARLMYHHHCIPNILSKQRAAKEP